MDQHILFLLNHKWTHPVLDRMLAILSCMDFWFPIMGLGAVVLVVRYGVRGAACLCVCALAILGNEELISQPLKTWSARARPHQAQEGVRRVDLAAASPRILAGLLPLQISHSGPPNPAETARRSFPSSHTLNATTLGIMFALLFRSRGWLLLPLLMAWSRVYTGAHWPTDVLASLCIGAIFNGLLLAAAEWLWRNKIARLRPGWIQQYPALIFTLQPKPLSNQSSARRS